MTLNDHSSCSRVDAQVEREDADWLAWLGAIAAIPPHAIVRLLHIPIATINSLNPNLKP